VLPGAVATGTPIHPAIRVNEHRNQTWSDEASKADYIEVLGGDLDVVEKQQIQDLNALLTLAAGRHYTSVSRDDRHAERRFSWTLCRRAAPAQELLRCIVPGVHV
jgi:hypothetical protein